jgi:hypothetical protein
MGFKHYFSRAAKENTLPGGQEKLRLTQILMPAADY